MAWMAASRSRCWWMISTTTPGLVTDGTQIAFSSNRDAIRYLCNEPRAATSASRGYRLNDYFPDVSDGSQIAFFAADWPSIRQTFTR